VGRTVKTLLHAAYCARTAWSLELEPCSNFVLQRELAVFEKPVRSRRGARLHRITEHVVTSEFLVLNRILQHQKCAVPGELENIFGNYLTCAFW
jgi:hypothetical protein